MKPTTATGRGQKTHSIRVYIPRRHQVENYSLTHTKKIKTILSHPLFKNQKKKINYNRDEINHTGNPGANH